VSAGPGSWLSHVDLAGFTSFGVPARARFFASLQQEDELPTLLQGITRRLFLRISKRVYDF
jgi:hypothetical protein